MIFLSIIFPITVICDPWFKVTNEWFKQWYLIIFVAQLVKASRWRDGEKCIQLLLFFGELQKQIHWFSSVTSSLSELLVLSYTHKNTFTFTTKIFAILCWIFNNVCIFNIKKVAQENLQILFTKLNRGRIIANKMFALVSLLCAVSKEDK